MIRQIISIHVPRVEDDVVLYLCPKKHFISIHVPRVEDDLFAVILFVDAN